LGAASGGEEGTGQISVFLIPFHWLGGVWGDGGRSMELL
jgi:hypothetical protein